MGTVVREGEAMLACLFSRQGGCLLGAEPGSQEEGPAAGEAQRVPPGPVTEAPGTPHPATQQGRPDQYLPWDPPRLLRPFPLAHLCLILRCVSGRRREPRTIRGPVPKFLDPKGTL